MHAAAQPSHDLAASRPFDDFDVNAVGTLNMLEGDATARALRGVRLHEHQQSLRRSPNTIRLREIADPLGVRRPGFQRRNSEEFSIDHSKHSLFGASKVAADVMVQEYGRYFGMKTCCFRGGCLTGPESQRRRAARFSQLPHQVQRGRRTYKIFGYKGKQVRDNIHAFDVARFIHAFYEKPRCGEVYNIGGGRAEQRLDPGGVRSCCRIERAENAI